MSKGKSQTFYRTFFLVTFLVFVLSLETAAKQVKPAAGGTENKEGARFSRWLEQAKGKAFKRRLRRMVDGDPHPNPGFVYLIAAFKAAQVQPAFVKIGRSRYPPGRVEELQTGSPYPLELFHQWEVKDMWKAELDAHKAMKQFNRAHLYSNTRFSYWNTEWFDIPPGGLQNVKGIVENAMGVNLV
ncbi:uncharacterized protein [Acropora muricata]|uniref:uncharacterized protein isoform X1 n=1 Tax=Acropora muricata TaxID=159855 RepID=UPI0034E42BDF